MGACFVSRTYHNLNEKSLIAQIKDDIEQDAMDDGTSYSGSWGATSGHIEIRHLTIFESAALAEEYLHENVQKWEGLIAVPYLKKLPKELENKLKREQDTLDKLSAIRRDRTFFVKSVVSRVKAQKSQFKSCTQCSSKIAVIRVHMAECPVCQFQDFVFSATDMKKLERFDEKAKQLLEEIENIKKTPTKLGTGSTLIGKDDISWIAGALCSS